MSTIGYSTDVRIFLEIGGEMLRVAQVGESSLILKDPRETDLSGDGCVVIVVNGESRYYPISISKMDSGQVVFFDAINTSRTSVKQRWLPFGD